MSRIAGAYAHLSRALSHTTVVGVVRPAIAASRPLAAAPVCFAPRIFAPRIFARAYNVNGNEVKTGSTIKWEGKTWLVLGTSVNMKGRAHTTYNIDLKDVGSTSKISIKVRPADKIEVIEMQTVRMNFLYRQGSVMFFMDPVSFEQIELDVSLAPGNAAYYLIEGSSTGLVRDGDAIVKINVPEKVVCTVESTSSSRGKVNDAGGKDAKLTNGLTITVPNHIEPGQHIIVSTGTETFVSKSDAPPAPEPEKTAF